MSFTLTNRDTTVRTMAVNAINAGGVSYFAAENGTSEKIIGLVRHSGSLVAGKGTARSNFHLERWKFDTNLSAWVAQKVDITVATDARSTWSADEVDDLLTWAFNYFDSEATSGAFVEGGNRS